ncbi:MAG: hypothetical protein AAGH90_11975 [Pseudomonadota bacterium]
MAEQIARQAEQKLAQLPDNQRQQVTRSEDSLAKWIVDAVAAGATYDLAKSAARLILSRGRRR